MSTKAAIRKGAARKLRDDYLELVTTFPLRPIRSVRDYDAAAGILDRLAVRAEGSLTPGERDYFETLTLLVEAYDDEHFRIDTGKLKPLDTLKYLMEQSGMTQKELGELLDNRALASLILNGHRAMSKAHMKLLGEHFKVDPGLFL